jgi:hypothetical protein
MLRPPNDCPHYSYGLGKGDRQEPPSIAEGIRSVNELGLAKILWAGILQRLLRLAQGARPAQVTVRVDEIVIQRLASRRRWAYIDSL